jgi:hypothetical protein
LEEQQLERKTNVPCMYRNHDAVCRKFGFHGRANGSRGEEISTEERWEDYHTQIRAKIATMNE